MSTDAASADSGLSVTPDVLVGAGAHHPQVVPGGGLREAGRVGGGL
jgi:hypothetical protein